MDNNLNHYQATAGTETQDLLNSASYDASSASISIGSSGGGAGVGNDSGSASSTSTAGISGIAGNETARTGDVETGLNPIFDQDRVRQEIDAQVAITAEFGQQASKLVGDIAHAKLEEALDKRLQARQADAAGDTERAAQLNAQADQLQNDWGDNGLKRLAAHTVIGALTGGSSGATGAALGTLSAPLVADALKEAGVDETLAKGLTALASSAAGAAAGSTAGAAAGFNEVVNNYLSHQELLSAKRELEGCAGNTECMGDVVQRYLALSDENLATAQADCVTSLEACQPHNLLHRDAMNALHDDRGGELFDISNEARPFLQVLMYENIGAEGAMAQATLTRFWEEQGVSSEWAAAMAALPIGLNKQVLKNRGSGGVVPSKVQTELVRIASDGHALARHGGVVTDQQLLVRAVTGVAPDGSSVVRNGQIVVPPSSTAFNSDAILAQSDMLVRQNYLDRAIALSKPGTTRVTVEGIDTETVIGRGYDRVSHVPGVQGPLQFHGDLSKVTAVYQYDATANVWRTITIYPVK
ncbi:hypothetical protein [Nitrincola sp.]|uniref:hypothetical protein n=1 Tax=Nitrincola sp. TaxID=1926584 RepID=UPI003A93275F